MSFCGILHEFSWKGSDSQHLFNTKDDGDIVTQKDSSQKDSLTSVIGEFGKYQKIWTFLVACTGISTSLLIFSNKFLTAEVLKPHQIRIWKRELLQKYIKRLTIGVQFHMTWTSQLKFGGTFLHQFLKMENLIIVIFSTYHIMILMKDLLKIPQVSNVHHGHLTRHITRFFI